MMSSFPLFMISGTGSDFSNNDFINNVSLSDLVDNFQSFVNFAKTSVVPIKMLRATSVHANKKL